MIKIITHTKLGRILKRNGCADHKAHTRALKVTYERPLTPEQALDCACHDGKE